MERLRSLGDVLLSFIFEYQTPRVVTMRHYKLGIFRLFLQVCILSFIFVFQIWYKKGYQTFHEVESSVTTKVKSIIKDKIMKELTTIKYCYGLWIKFLKYSNFILMRFRWKVLRIQCFREQRRRIKYPRKNLKYTKEFGMLPILLFLLQKTTPFLLWPML